MTSEVGSGQVAIFPTFKGFRNAVEGMVGGTTKSATASFRTGFGSAGTVAGKSFKQSFSSSSSGAIAASVKSATAEVAKSSRELATLRLKELDAAGKVRVATAQLGEALQKYSANSSQAVRAEERFQTAQRGLLGVQDSVKASTDRLAASKRGLAAASVDAASSNSKLGGSFAQLPNLFGGAGGVAASRFGASFKTGIGTIFAGSFLANIASSVGRGIGDLIRTGVGLTFDSVGLASTLEQNLGAADAVFKDQSKGIQEYGKTAATSVGLAQTEYLSFAVIVGAQLKNLKVPFDQVAGKTNDIIKLGADLAAQFGGDTSQAVGALSSLLRGERDPIERYGVSLKQTDIDARKAALGLNDLTGEADKQAEIQATLSLLWEQTADAQGTFFRESDTYAHKQQVMNAELQETQTKLGESLLPAFTSGLTFINDELLPKLTDIVDVVGPQLGQALIDNGPEFEALWTKAEPLITGLIGAAGSDGIPAFIGVMNDIVKAAPDWAAAFDTAFDPNAQPAKFLNDLADGLNNAGLAVHDFLFGQASEDRKQWFGDLFTGSDTGGSGVYGSGQSTGEKYGQGAVDGLNSQLPVWLRSGSDFADGFTLGVTSPDKLAAAGAAGAALGAAADKGLRDRLLIFSPSKVMQKLGGYTADGFVKGIVGGNSSVLQVSKDMASLAVRGGLAVTAGVATAAGSSGGSGSSGRQAVYAEGNLIGWISDVAGGVSQFVVDKSEESDQKAWRRR